LLAALNSTNGRVCLPLSRPSPLSCRARCSADGTTRLSYAWGWRSLVAGAGACKAVRSQRGDFLSDALRWTYVMDERDSATVHTEVGAQLPPPLKWRAISPHRAVLAGLPGRTRSRPAEDRPGCLVPLWLPCVATLRGRLLLLAGLGRARRVGAWRPLSGRGLPIRQAAARLGVGSAAERGGSAQRRRRGRWARCAGRGLVVARRRSRGQGMSRLLGAGLLQWLQCCVSERHES
jgi:hypothetical protein